MRIDVVNEGGQYTFIIGSTKYVFVAENIKVAIDSFLKEVELQVYRSIDAQTNVYCKTK